MTLLNTKFAVTLAVCCITHVAAAQGFVSPDSYGWSRGDADSSYFEWDDFSTATGPNAPDVAALPSPLPEGWVEPTITETTGTAFVTSTGNIYSITTVLEFEIVVPAEPIAGGTTTVVLQTKTQGREIDASTLVCNGESPVEIVELYRFNLGPDDVFGGDLVETLWRFEIPATGTATIAFSATAESMSFDIASVDTYSEDANCPADVNGDGAVTPADFTAWIAAFNMNAPQCDQNGDESCTPADFTAWIANYNNGC